jgi:molybdenum cofactor cytidylyltransferase
VIVALLLAAGAGRRFGGQKLLANMHGAPLIRRSAERLAHPDLDGILVVVPPASRELRDALDGIRCTFATNDDPARGMGRSIRIGIEAMPSSASAAIIALADQILEPRWISAVTARYRDGGARIVAPFFQGAPGHPVLFDRAVFAELAQLDGDRGARDVVTRDPARVATIEIGDPPAIDVDTADDLRRLEAL